eukprot:TRINITY_DN529_c1_g1_i1.p1 TRINITY_DN529_c1_g1~~TRINITY_DN529_c1_g1_i1.p1  ORF type:complete len:174 (+),score=22.36 TRINITY_DN529_c1_g1_i1:239-760(+)
MATRVLCYDELATSPALSEGSASTWELSSADEGATVCGGATAVSFDVEEQRGELKRERELQWAVVVADMHAGLSWGDEDGVKVLKILLEEAARLDVRRNGPAVLPKWREYSREFLASLETQSQTPWGIRGQLVNCHTFLPGPHPDSFHIDHFSSTLRRQNVLAKLRQSGSLFL